MRRTEPGKTTVFDATPRRVATAILAELFTHRRRAHSCMDEVVRTDPSDRLIHSSVGR